MSILKSIWEPVSPDMVFLSLNSKFEIVAIQGFVKRKALIETDRFGKTTKDQLELIGVEIDFPKHFWDIPPEWEAMGQLGKEADYQDGNGYIRHLFMRRN